MYFLILIGQLLLYWLLMLADEYLGTLLAAIIAAVGFAVWALSYVVEWISPSKVSRKYYSIVLITWLSPLLAMLTFLLLRGGQVGWLQNF